MDAPVLKLVDPARRVGTIEPLTSSGERRIHLFGPFTLLGVDLDLDLDTAKPLSRKARAVLAYLWLTPGRQAERSRLAGLLWSQRGEDQARASLRQTLYEFRSLADGARPLLQWDRSTVRIVDAHAESDLDRLRAAGANRDAEAMSALIGDRPSDLLAGFDGIDPGYDEWLLVERMQRHDERRRLVLTVATAALAGSEAAAAHRLCQALLAADSHDEAAARLAMEAAAAQGDRDAVRSTYQRLQQALRSSVEQPPSDDTTALHARLVAAPLPTPPPAPAPAASGSIDPPDVSSAPPALRTEPVPQAPVTAALTTTVASSPAQPLRRATVWWAVAVSAAVAVAVVATATWWHTPPAALHRTLVVEPLQVDAGDGAAQSLRVGLAADLSRLIVGNDATLAVVDAGRVAAVALPSSAFVVSGEARSDAGLLHAHIKLQVRGGMSDGDIVWSSSFTRADHDVDALREQMATKLADVAVCAVGGHNPSLAELGADTLRLYLAGCEEKHGDWSLCAKLMKQVIARRPAFAHAWAMYAASLAVSTNLLPGNQEAALFRDADTAAHEALRLDPNEGEAYFALAETLPRLHQWKAKRELLLAGIAVEPGNAQLLSELGTEQSRTGLTGEALALARRAFERDPFSPGKVATLAKALAFNDDLVDATALLTEQRPRFPLSHYLGRTDLLIKGLVGDPSQAAALLDAPDRGFVLTPDRNTAWVAMLQARMNPSPAVIDAAVAAQMALVAKDPEQNRIAVIARLTVLGRTEQAYAHAMTLTAAETDEADHGILFWNVMAPFRADRRFMTVAARLGLVAVWRETQHWPDFCGDGSVPYDCKVEAERAIAAQRS